MATRELLPSAPFLSAILFISSQGPLPAASLASCGWTPSARKRKSYLPRTPSTGPKPVVLDQQPTVIIDFSPASFALATTPSRSSANLLSSRWAWLSIKNGVSIGYLPKSYEYFFCHSEGSVATEESLHRNRRE